MKVKWVQTHTRDSRMQFHSTTPRPQEVCQDFDVGYNHG